ncbi:hypothetical protein [Sphingomonas sp. CFBP8993]|nr:hypothetical protein [Sphingomonas sp. CFBP8993]
MIAARIACTRQMTAFDSSLTERAERSITSGSLCFEKPMRFSEDSY